MSNSGDDDEIIGSIAGDLIATYGQIRVEMESGEFVVTGFYLNQRLSTKLRRCLLAELTGVSGKLELNNPDEKRLWVVTGESGKIQIRTEKPE